MGVWQVHQRQMGGIMMVICMVLLMVILVKVVVLVLMRGMMLLLDMMRKFQLEGMLRLRLLLLFMVLDGMVMKLLVLDGIRLYVYHKYSLDTLLLNVIYNNLCKD